MSRRKKTATHYNKAVARLAALKSISSTLDLGNGLTIASYETAITNLNTTLGNYNTTLSMVDEQLNSVNDAEKKVQDLSERFLAGVASKYGKNSDEYEKAEGVKKNVKDLQEKRLLKKAVNHLKRGVHYVHSPFL